MAKQLNSYQINLGFTADTSKAKRQLQDLQKQLTQIINQPIASDMGADMAKKIREASVAATELKVHLQNATNIDTGALDFTKFNQSIQKSGASIDQYADKLRELGPAGKQAFLSLVQSVVNAEVPLKRSNQLVAEMWTTLKNAARWQISSSVLHGFMGALQGAVGYAQDLNESLNNIRIVTGNNIDQMAKFAEEANKAARALSTTTTNYTDASLIYFQQGLDEQQVEERTAVTIKMANAAGVSAEKVSDQMTAVWNNFYDGSKSLEYYADVMTALGAATASSTDEISEGLNKFAAVAETVGLSYEYATAALATVTSETRESADIVGTAYKTLFARIQGLQQGETLDDGTTLNKYSKALANVGIQIKDEVGNMKKMDDILNELGAKWGTLAKDQQLALAQTVAGVRQYTQLVALMDNWDVFQENLGTAYGSEGALTEQAEIYAESWEAARDRVRASFERIYQTLIDDEFFIDFLNGIDTIVDGVGNFIDAIGGLKGVLISIGAIAVQVFSKQIGQTINDSIYNLKMKIPNLASDQQKKKNQFLEKQIGKINPEEFSNPLDKAREQNLKQQLILQNKLAENADKMNDLELMVNQTLIDRQKILSDNFLKSSENLKIAQDKKGQAAIDLRGDTLKKLNIPEGTPKGTIITAKGTINNAINTQTKKIRAAVTAENKLANISSEIKITADKNQIKNEVAKISEILKTLKDEAKIDIDVNIDGNESKEVITKKIEQIQAEVTEEIDSISEKGFSIKTDLGTVEANTEKVKTYTEACRKEIQMEQQSTESKKYLEQGYKDVEKSIEEVQGKQADWSERLAEGVGAVFSVISSVQMLSSAIKNLFNEDMTAGEKIVSLLSALAITIPSLISGFNSMSIAINGVGVSGAAAGTAITLGFWPIVGIMGAIAAAVFGVTIVVSKLQEEQNKEIRKLEQLQKTNEQLNESYQESSKIFNELESNLDTYNDLINKLEQTIKGTNDWKEALENVNDQINELIKIYPQLLDQKELFNEDGYLNTDVITKIINQQKKSMEAIQYASMLTELDILKTDRNYDKEDLGNWTANNYNLDPEAQTRFQENLNENAQITTENFKDLINDVTTEGVSLSQHFETFSEYIDNINENNEKIAIRQKNILLLLSNNEEIAEKYGNVSTVFAASGNQKIADREKSEILSTMQGWKQKDKSNKDLENLWTEFESIVGEQGTLDSNAIRGASDQRTIHYFSTATGEIEKYSADYIASIISAQRALESLETSAESINRILSNMSGAGAKFIEYFSDDYTQEDIVDSLTNYSQGQLETMFSSGEKEDLFSYLGIDESQFKELAKAKGYLDENGEGNVWGYYNALKQGYNTLARSEDYNLNEISGSIKQEKDYRTQKGQIASVIQKPTNDIVASMKGQDPQTIIDFLTDLNSIELTDEDSVQSVKDLIEQYNLQGESTESLIKQVEALDKTYNVSTESIREQAAILKEVVGDGLEVGSIISEEDIDKLRTAGIDTSDYFTLMADNTYALTNHAKDFNEVVKQITLAQLKQQLVDYESARQGVLNNYNGLTEGQLLSGIEDTSNTKDNATLARASLDYARSFGDMNFSRIEGATELLNLKIDEDFEWTEEHLNIINQMIGQINSEEIQTQTQLLNSAETLSELYGQISTMDNVSYEAISASLVNLASQYENCSKEIEEYHQALGDGEEKAIKNAQASLEQAIAIGELAEKYDLNAESLENYAERLEEDEDGTKRSKKAALDLAVMNTRLNRGISDLYDNFEDYTKILKKSNKDSAEYSETMDSMKNILADVFNVADGSMLSDSFVEGLIEDGAQLKKIMEGDIATITELRMKVADDVVMNIVANIDDQQLATEINGYWEELQAWMQENKIDLSVETEISGDSEFVTTLNNMIDQANMTKDQVNSLLGSMGMSAELVTTPEKQEMTVPTYDEYWEPMVSEPEVVENGEVVRPAAFRRRKYTVPGEPLKVEGYAEAVAIKTTAADGTTSGGAIKVIAPKATTNYSNTPIGRKDLGKSKSSSKPAKPSAVKKTGKNDVVERYKEINDQLDDMADKMEDASTEADRLYGKDRIKAMNQVNNILQSEIDLLEQKKEEAQDYLKLDKQALQQAAKKAGLGDFTFDASGNITNYEEQMEAMYKRLAAAQEKAQPKNFSTKEAQDAYIEKNVTPLEEQIAELETAIGQYDETRELIEDLDNEARDKFNEWQDNNFEILNYKLELDLELNDSELKQLDYMLGKIEDDYYNLAEAAALMVGETAELQQDQIGGQMDVHFDNLDRLRKQNNDLIDSYRNGEISQDAFMSGMKDLEDQVYDNLGSIQELDDSMVHYYGDTLEKAAEELEKYTELMEHQTEVLEHYTNVMDILGKSTDYKAMSVILEAQVKNAENALKVSQDNYEILNKQALDRRAELEQALINGATEAEVEIIQQKWLDAQNAANEAQSKMMADTEAWAESLKAVLENKLAGFGQALENALTGDFGSFDEMNNAMERANSLQEEYLTTTNQIYETDKLINQAQKDIDKTTNTAAKKRLQNYIKETEQLQNQSQLSQYELEIQQAKYDLLLAEIALEEAQDAKSMVRLQRDSEGNFGYVYTADQNKVAEAEQQLADAQNRLYNIGLEGANSYTEKYQQTLGEMYDTLTDLQEQYLSGAFENEQEYNDAVTAAKEFYYDKLKQYSDLYAVALTTDSRVVADAWSTDFNDMIYSTDDWAAAVDDYVAQVQDAFADWEEQVADIRENTVGEDLDDLKELVDGVTDASDELAEAITEDNGLLDALEAEIEDVNNLTSAYANMRKQIQSAQEDYENLIKKINKAKEDPNSAEKMDEVDFGQKKTQSISESEKQADATGAMGKDIDTSKIKKGSIVEVKPGAKWFYDSYGSTPTGPAKDGEIDAVNLNGTYQYNIKGLGWIRRSDIKAITKYDTGGYTGSWGSYGKLAMLHEKELILNKHDTENFLASMDILHNILQALDLNSLSNQLGGVLSTPQLGSMTEQTLEQNVTIEANFPGVSVASEIEEAFGNLVNLASQYANRK